MEIMKAIKKYLEKQPRWPNILFWREKTTIKSIVRISSKKYDRAKFRQS